MKNRKNIKSIKITHNWDMYHYDHKHANVDRTKELADELATMDVSELSVSMNDCSEAKSMLAAIGIRC